LAQVAQDDDALETLMGMYKDLETRKQKAEGMLVDVEEDEEKRAEIEAELVKFETWAARVQPFLTDPTCISTYQEQRLAIRILGIKAVVQPTNKESPPNKVQPGRVKIAVTVPGILEKCDIVHPETRFGMCQNTQKF
jgi:hypothetical protein